MKIGVGFTTYKRKNIMQQAYDKFIEHTFDVVQEAKDGGMMATYTPKDGNEYIYYCAKDTDEDRKGIAARKNECLRALKDCDFVFLFDDDCFPVKDGWANFFIDSGFSHLLFLSDKLHNKKESLDNMDIYNDCGGVFMFMTKGAIEKVGAYNEDFKIYGFEHAEYSRRILGFDHAYPMLIGTEDYIFAHDYSTEGHKSSIKDEEKDKLVKNNWDKYFKEEIKNVYLPL